MIQQKRARRCAVLLVMLSLLKPLCLSVRAEAPSDPLYPEQWSLAALGYDAIRESGADGSGVVIALLDSGVDTAHPDLEGLKISDFSRNFLGNGEHPEAYDRDQIGHGTFAAGLISARPDNGIGIAGIAPGAELMILRCFSGEAGALPYDEAYDSGSGSPETAAEAIRYAVDNGADLLNLSFGMLSPAPELEEAVRYALDCGVSVICAVGTAGGSAYYYPAAYDGVIGVGSIRSGEGGYERSDFSQRNASVRFTAPGEALVSLAAGKDGVWDWRIDSGTSFAAPLITGLAALALETDPSLTPQQLTALLEASAVDLGEPGWDRDFGSGLPDAERLLDLLAGGRLPAAALPFADVPEDAWYAADAAWAYETGMMKGVSETAFCPEQACSRAMLVTLLWRLNGCPEAETEASFADVPQDAWYAKALSWAYGAGIVNGVSPTAFAPTRWVSRQDFVTMLFRCALRRETEIGWEPAALDAYHDADMIPDYAVPALCWACGSGLLRGSGELLMPEGNVTRAQAAALLHRYCGGA